MAKLAGVSQRTVSNVVNGYVHVKPETRVRVQDAISTLNFRPNVSAQRLRKGKTGLLALAMPEIAAPYFAELADLVQRAAELQGSTLLIEQTGGTRERELQVLDGYQANLIDGLILSPLAISARDLEQRSLDFPTVLLGESVSPGSFLHIGIDNVAAARMATEHLIQSGRTKVGVIGAPSLQQLPGPATRRMQGFRDALGLAGLGVRPDRVFETTSWTRATGYAFGRQIAQDGMDVDALFCFNDLLALGVMKGLQSAGIRVPSDIAVVGWDDVQESAYATPTLTTISPDTAEIARRAVEGVLAPEVSAPTAADVVIAFSLIERESTLRG
ncbi:LacI family DNA-binding transcriptional regulator [Microbacterium sp. X-17]|uniref:LacI family DNA-binding transcriptional regulator n=1 Tax=Microbacterium sp. X-17 TaxID=3144404 RepID=UPI0031F4C42E